MDDGKRKAGGHCGIDGIATGAQHLNASARRQFVDAGNNGMWSVRRTQRRGGDGRGEQSAHAAEDQKITLNAHGLVV
jgi:hypothetical protein